MLNLQKYFKNFQKRSISWNMRKVAIVVENFMCTDILFFSSNVATFPTSRKCKNLNFSLHTVPSEVLYLQKYLKNFQKQSFDWKMMIGGYCGWRISRAQTFCFCNSNVTTFPTSRKCNNFNFSLYTVPAEMLYPQKYLTNFQKLSFSWKIRNVAIVVENFKCTDILVLP